MNLKTVKTTADLPFKGIELVKVDAHITEIIIGGKLRIRKGESYSPGLQLLVDQPHEEMARVRVTAKLDGFDPKVSYVETDYEAQSIASSFEDKGAVVVTDKVTALINDSGEVVGIKGDEPVPAHDEIPF